MIAVAHLTHTYLSKLASACDCQNLLALVPVKTHLKHHVVPTQHSRTHAASMHAHLNHKVKHVVGKCADTAQSSLTGSDLILVW